MNYTKALSDETLVYGYAGLPFRLILLVDADLIAPGLHTDRDVNTLPMVQVVVN